MSILVTFAVAIGSRADLAHLSSFALFKQLIAQVGHTIPRVDVVLDAQVAARPLPRGMGTDDGCISGSHIPFAEIVQRICDTGSARLGDGLLVIAVVRKTHIAARDTAGEGIIAATDCPVLGHLGGVTLRNTVATLNHGHGYDFVVRKAASWIGERVAS